MKTRKARLTAVISMVALGMALLFNGAAWAGAKSLTEVNVYPGGAYGSMMGARFGKGKEQFIRCSLSYSTWVSSIYMSCSAYDKDEKYASCYSDDWRFREIVKSMTDSSFIEFQFNNSGECTYLYVRNASKNLK